MLPVPVVWVVGVQEREGVSGALLEDGVGELPIAQRAGELQRPEERREQSEESWACRVPVVGGEACGDVVDDVQQAGG